MIIKKQLTDIQTDKKITILTCVFKDYDILHEQPFRDDIEYICITDNNNLANTEHNQYNIINFKEFNIPAAWSGRQKTYFLRYNPFNFCKTEKCIWMDASIQFTDFGLNKFIEHDNDLVYLESTKLPFYIFGNNDFNNALKGDWLFKNFINLYDYFRKNNIFGKTYCDTYAAWGAIRFYKKTQDIIDINKKIFDILDTYKLSKNDILYFDEIISSIYYVNILNKTTYMLYNNKNNLIFKKYYHNDPENVIHYGYI